MNALPVAILHGAVPNAYVRLLFEYLEQRGEPSALVLGQSPPPAEPLHGRFAVQRWRVLLERAAAHLRDPLLGLHLGQAVSLAHLGVMGYVLLACPDVGAALQRFATYQRLLYDVSPMRYELDADSVALAWGIEAGRPGALVDECAITALVHFLRDITAARAQPREVHFVNPAPADRRPYLDYFGCDVRFGQALTRVRYPLAALGLPLREPDPLLMRMLERQAASLLAELPARSEIEQAVRQCIARLAPEGEPTLERVAVELHLSARTLHRRLAQEGGQFRGLRDDTRRRLADDYLADRRLQLAEIAQLLGYSEQSAFTRAYRRWTGETPRVARQRLARTSQPS